MSEAPDTETVEIGELDFDEWNEYALAQGWGDGFPLMVPTEDKVAALVGMCRGDNEPFPPMSPRRVVPIKPVEGDIEVGRDLLLRELLGRDS